MKDIMELKKLNLGCGDQILPGYVNCDLYDSAADVKCDAAKLPFEDSSIEEIYSSHLIEHFDYKEAFEVLREWKRVLKPRGTLIIETPDFLASCKKFVEGDAATRLFLYGHFFSVPWENPGQVHKFLYTPDQLRWTLEQLEFKDIRQEPALRYIGREEICLKMIATK